MSARDTSLDDPDRRRRRQLCGVLGALLRSVEHGDVTGAGPAEGVDHGASGTARTDDRDPRARHVDADRCERTDEPGAVGARPDEPVAVPTHRVHRLQGPCRRIEPIDRRRHISLVRHRDRHPTDAEHPHRLDRCAAVAGRDIECGVGPVDARPPRTRRGGWRATGCARRVNRSTPRGQDRERSSTNPGHSRPASSAARTLASCCSLVAANTWLPSSSPST